MLAGAPKAFVALVNEGGAGRRSRDSSAYLAALRLQGFPFPLLAQSSLSLGSDNLEIVLTSKITKVGED